MFHYCLEGVHFVVLQSLLNIKTFIKNCLVEIGTSKTNIYKRYNLE